MGRNLGTFHDSSFAEFILSATAYMVLRMESEIGES
jgi:hypothetical protein